MTVTVTDSTTDENGATATIQFELSSQPTHSVRIALTSNDTTEGTVSGSIIIEPGNWNIPANNEITITGQDDDIIDGTIAYTIITGDPTSGDTNYDSLNAAAVADQGYTNLDNDTAAINVTTISGDTTETGNTATFQVTLDSQPTHAVRIPLTSSDTTEGTVSGSIIIEPGNWNNGAANTVTVTGQDDVLIDGTIAYTIITGDPTSPDSDYDALTAGSVGDVAVNNIDDDGASITVTVTDATTDENGATATIQFELSSQPSHAVRIPLTSSDTTEGTVSGSIIIEPGNWNIPANNQITVTGVDDDIIDGTIAYTITTGNVTSADSNYNALTGAAVADPNLTNADNDTAGITVTTTDTQTDENGDTATIRFQLTSEPTHAVRIPLTSNDITEGTISGSVIIEPGNWNNPGANEITITGVNDDIIDGTIAYTIITGDPTSGDTNYDSLNAAAVADQGYTNLDNDTAAINVTTISGDTTETGNTATFQVTLDSQPSHAVRIPLTSSDTTEGTVSGSIIIEPGNWNNGAANTVTVTGQDDVLIDGTIAYTIITGDPTSPDSDYEALTAGSVGDVAVNNIDDDGASITVTITDSTTNEGGTTAAIRFNLSSAPTHSVRIPLTSSDTTEGTVSGSIIIEPADWNLPANNEILITGIDDDIIDGTIAYTIVTGDPTSGDANYDTIDASSVSDAALTNEDNDTAGVTVTVTDATTDEDGATGTIQFQLTSQPTHSVRITLTSADTTEASISGSVIIEPTNWNIPANNEITITGVDDDIIDGTIAYNITTGDVTSGDTNYDILGGASVADAPLTNADNDTAGINVTAISGDTTEAGATATFQVTLTSQPTHSVRIPLSSDDITEGTVSGSIIIQPSNWNIGANNIVTVTGADDVLIDGTIAYNIVTGDPTSTDANYDSLTAGSVGDVSVNNLDDDGANITLIAVDTVTGEDASTGAIRFTLSSEPTAPVRIALSSSDTTEGTVSGSIIIEPSDWNNALANQIDITGVDDDIIDGTIAYTITTGDVTSVDSNYDTLNAGSVADQGFTNTDNDSAGVTVITTDSTTDENGATGTIQFQLTSQPTHSVRIALTSNDTTEASVSGSVIIEPTNWNIPGNNQITITGQDDDIIDGTIAYSITTGNVTSADSNYNALTGAAVSDPNLTNADNDTAGITVTLVDTQTDENGDTARVRIELNSEPSHSVRIPLSSDDTTEGTVSGSIIIEPSNWNVAANNEITITGIDDDTIDGTVGYNLSLGDITSVDPDYDALTGGTSYGLTNLDNDTAAINVTTISGDTTETGNTATFQVTLDSQPSHAVRIPLTSSDTTEGTVSGSIIIEPGNWNNGAANTVTVTGQDDVLIDGTIAYTIITGDPTSPDSDYEALTAGSVGDVAVNNIDDDGASITVTITDSTTNEGGTTAAIRFNLSSAPTHSVRIPLTSSDTTEGTVSGSIIIEPADWNLPANNEILITGIDDDIIDGTIAYTIVTGDPTSGDANYDTIDASSVSDAALTNEDNDTAGVTVTVTDATTDEDGATGTIQFQLTSQPTHSVRITLTSADTTEASISGSVIIEPTNWNIPANNEITITGVDDDIIDGTIAYNITTGDVTSGDTNYDILGGASVADAPLTNADNDTAGINVTAISGDTTEAGATATFQVTLTSQPTHSVRIPLSSDDITEGTVSGSIIIQPSNWNIGANNIVTVTGADDVLIDGTIAYNIVTGDPTSTDANYDSLTAGSVGDVSVNNLDDDGASIFVTVVDSTTDESGATATIEFALSSTPTHSVRIPLSSSDTTEGTVSGSIIIEPSNWNIPASNQVIITGADDVLLDGTIAYNLITGDPQSPDANFDTLTALSVSDPSLTNTDNDAVGVNVTAISGNTTESGALATFQVTLLSQPSHSVYVPLSSTDTTEGTVSGSIIIEPADWNNGAANTVTVTGVDDVFIDGTIAYAIVTGDVSSGNSGYDAVTAGMVADIAVNNLDNDVAGIDVSAISGDTTEGGATAAFQVTLRSQPTHSVRIPLTSDNTTEGTVSGSIIIEPSNWNNGAANTVIVTGQDDAITDGTIAYSIITGDPTSPDGDYDALNAASVTDVSVNNIDNDAVGVVVSATDNSTGEDRSTGTLQFSLTFAPTHSVRIALSSSDITEGTVSGSVIIEPANWNIPANNQITVTGVDDSLVDGNIAYTIITGDVSSVDAAYDALTAGNVSDIAMTNADNDVSTGGDSGGSGGGGPGGGCRGANCGRRAAPPPPKQSSGSPNKPSAPQEPQKPDGLSCELDIRKDWDAVSPEDLKATDKLELLVDAFGKQYTYTDTYSTFWFATFVRSLTINDVVLPQSEDRISGLFRGEDSVTYGELAKLIVLGSEQLGASGVPNTLSARNHWSAPFVKRMEVLDISLYADNPDLDVDALPTRFEVISAIMETYGIEDTNFVYKIDAFDYNDVSEEELQAREDIAKATHLGIVSGYANEDGELLNVLGATRRALRGEVAKMIVISSGVCKKAGEDEYYFVDAPTGLKHYRPTFGEEQIFQTNDGYLRPAAPRRPSFNQFIPAQDGTREPYSGFTISDEQLDTDIIEDDQEEESEDGQEEDSVHSSAPNDSEKDFEWIDGVVPHQVEPNVEIEDDSWYKLIIPWK